MSEPLDLEALERQIEALIAARRYTAQPLTLHELLALIQRVREAEQQVDVLKPGGMFAWKDKAQKAEAEIARLTSCLLGARQDADGKLKACFAAEAEVARLTERVQEVEEADTDMAAAARHAFTRLSMLLTDGRAAEWDEIADAAERLTERVRELEDAAGAGLAEERRQREIGETDV